MELQAHTSVFQAEIERTTQPQSSVANLPGCPVKMAMSVTCGGTVATPAVRAGPKQTMDGGRHGVVRAAMTLLAMGPHWPDHSPTREEVSVPPVCRRVPPSASWNLEGFARSRHPMVGFHVVNGAEEVKQPQSILRTDIVLMAPFGTVLSVTPDFDLPRSAVVLGESAS